MPLRWSHARCKSRLCYWISTSVSALCRSCSRLRAPTQLWTRCSRSNGWTPGCGPTWFASAARYMLPDAVSEISQAVHNGIGLEASSPLAKQIERISDDMLGDKKVHKNSNAVRRFVEYFSVSPARESRRS